MPIKNSTHTAPAGAGASPACPLPSAATRTDRGRRRWGLWPAAALTLWCAVACANSAAEAPALYERAAREYEEQNLDRALELFKESARKDASLHNARLMAAKIYYYKKDFPRALEELDALLERNGGHAGALYWKGRVLALAAPAETKKGETGDREAMECLVKALEIDAHHLPARALLALLYEKNRLYREALREYHLLLQEEESVFNARANLALLYRRMGLKERSRREIAVAIAMARAAGIHNGTLKAIKEEIEQ